MPRALLRRRCRTAGLVALAALLAACGGDAASRQAVAPEPTQPPSSTTTTSTNQQDAAPPTTVAEAAPGLRAPAQATDAADLARRLVDAELALRDPQLDPDRLDQLAFDQQVLYRQLGRRPDWDAAVLAAAPADLRGAIEANVAARRAFRGMHSTLAADLPAWRIVEPEPAEVLLGHYRDAEATFGVPWEVLAAVNLVETGMGRIRGVSIAGARGPMQFMPATWDAFGEGDVEDPRDAIFAAARYLAHNGGGRGEVANALWNYNHSDRYVDGVQRYAAVLAEEPRAYLAYHRWQVVYLTTAGDVWLPTGFEAYERVPAVEHLARNPGHHLGDEPGS